MRLANLVVAAICGGAVVVAAIIAWQGRRLPITTRRTIEPRSGRESALDALRWVAIVTTAALIAGVLVAGLGGRLVMRVLAATSGNSAQGLLTEAEQPVGEITFGGTLSIVIFVGVLLPVAASFLYLVIRVWLPNRSWTAGLTFGLLLLAVFGVSDPLSPDNVDFAILRPRVLAVALIILTALLFGVTFTAVAARLDARLPILSAPGRAWRTKLPYASLVVVLLPFFLIPAAVYIGVRSYSQGRIGALIDRSAVRTIGRVIMVLGVCGAGFIVAQTAADIL